MSKHALTMAMLGLVFHQGSAQTVPRKPLTPPLKTGSEQASKIPDQQLVFEASEPTPGVSASPVVLVPSQCNSDGTLFLEMLSPPDFRGKVIYSISGKTSHIFSLASVPDLNHADNIGMFPSPSGVTLLVRAAKSESVVQQNPVGKVSEADYSYYTVNFNSDGTYDKSTRLNMPEFVPFHFAVLASGRAVVAGFDHANSVTRVLLLNESGEEIRVLDIPDAISEPGAVRDPNSLEGVVETGNLLSSIHFTSFQDKVLMWRTGVKAPIIEINKSGSVRQISFQSPSGYSLADLVSSTTDLVLHFEPATRRDGQAQNTSETVYYTAKVSDGGLMHRLSLLGDAPGSIACEAKGQFVGYKTDNDGKLFLLTAR